MDLTIALLGAVFGLDTIARGMRGTTSIVGAGHRVPDFAEQGLKSVELRVQHTGTPIAGHGTVMNAGGRTTAFYTMRSPGRLSRCSEVAFREP